MSTNIVYQWQSHVNKPEQETREICSPIGVTGAWPVPLGSDMIAGEFSGMK